MRVEMSLCVSGNKMPGGHIEWTMLAQWTGAFIVGILLGKSGLFPNLQNIGHLVPTGFILAPAALVYLGLSLNCLKFAGALRGAVIASCALLWGFVHAAPEYVGPCIKVKNVRVSMLQVGRAPTIVSHGGRNYEIVKNLNVVEIGGAEAGTGFLWNRVRSSNCSAGPKAEFHPYTELMLERFLSAGGVPELIPWIGATVFGSRKGLSIATEKSFRETGLVHILVVSGMHVSLFALFVRIALLLPVLPVYVLTFLNAGLWRLLVYWSELLSLPFVCFYVWLIGSPNPAQRAAAFYAAWVFGKLFFGLRRPVERFAICLMVQTILFPIGFLGAGNVMSWLATLFVVTNVRAREGDPWSDFLSVFDWRLQVRIMVIAAAMFAELAPLSILGNILLAPAFGVLLQMTYLIVIFPGSWFSTLLHFQTETYLALVKILADSAAIPGLSALAWRPLGAVMRIFTMGVGCVMVLNSLRHLSIRTSEAAPFSGRVISRIKPS